METVLVAQPHTPHTLTQAHSVPSHEHLIPLVEVGSNSLEQQKVQVQELASQSPSHYITSFLGQRPDAMRWPPCCYTDWSPHRGGATHNGRGPGNAHPCDIHIYILKNIYKCLNEYIHVRLRVYIPTFLSILYVYVWCICFFYVFISCICLMYNISMYICHV